MVSYVLRGSLNRSQAGSFLVGLFVGLALSLSLRSNVSIAELLTVLMLSALYSWMEFRLPVPELGNLSALPVLILGSIATLEVAAVLLLVLVGPLMAKLVRGGSNFASRLAEGSKLSLQSLALLGPPIALYRLSVPMFSELSSLILALVLYLVIDSALRLLPTLVTNRTATPRLSDVLRILSPYWLSMLLASLILREATEFFGFLGFVLSSAMLVELAYPWKMLNDQTSLFLTSLVMVSEATDLKDPYTARHSRRVSSLAARVARVLGLRESEVQRVRIAGLLHDIGKMGVPVGIIRKPSGLTKSEIELMQQHPVIGADLVEGLDVIGGAAELVRHSHEHMDGGGYPAGLMGEAIPLGSRIILAVDAFDALTTDRPYRKRRSHEDALKILQANAGAQFDPKVVQAIRKVLERG